MLQEDPGNSAHNAKIWQYTIATDSLKLIAKHDSTRFGDIGVPATAPFNQDEESSGIIDVSDILGAGNFLFVDQAHYTTGLPVDAVEAGQLLKLFNPDTYANSLCATTSSDTVTACGSYLWNGITYTQSGTYIHQSLNTVGCFNLATLHLTITPPCNTNLTGKCYIQGFYLGGNLMQPALVNGGIAAPATACDSIDIELRDAALPNTIVASGKTLLNQDGTFSYSFPALNGEYYIVIKHRSALQTWSANPIMFSGTSVQYDFSTSANKAYGDNMIELEPGKWAFYSGDVAVDENMDLLDLGMAESDISNFGYGYLATDINGDGNVDLLDTPILEGNISNFIYSVHP